MSKLKRLHEKLEEFKSYVIERDRSVELLKKKETENEGTIAYLRQELSNSRQYSEKLQDRLREYEGTPANRREISGEKDPHERYLDKERSDLAMGNLTDDEIANAIFMNYDVFPSVQDLVSGKGIMPIAYMTAGKERIRWLSRKLNEALDKLKELA